MDKKPQKKSKFKVCPKCNIETVLAICSNCGAYVQKIELNKKHDTPKNKKQSSEESSND